MPPPSSMSQDQIAKLQSELDIVTMNMTVLGDMLTELKPGQEDPSDYQLLTELVATCREMQNRIVELLGKVNHDELTAELLRLNDELNSLFLRYARFEKNRDPKTASSTTPSAILGAAMGLPTSAATAADKKESLIDLSDEATGVTGAMAGLNLTAASQLSQLSSVTAQSGAANSTAAAAGVGKQPDVITDEFDIFAQSRNTTGDNSKDAAKADSTGQNKSVPLDDIEHLDQLEGGGAGGSNGAGGPEESLTSKEFEKFLAERAAVADNLPSISSQVGSGTAKSTTKKKSDEDDGLLAL